MAADLTCRCGRGFGYRNLYQMRQLYLTYPHILQTASAKLGKRTPSGQPAIASAALAKLGKSFPLTWSHYVRLMAITTLAARSFYETEALRGGWTVRQFDLIYAREHWTRPDENPSVGLILCAEHGGGVAKYALPGLSNNVLAARYCTVLPSEEALAAEMDETRKMLESRRRS